MEWRFATAVDAPLLAELNHQLIADEGHGNPMDAEQLQRRLLRWLVAEYKAVLFSRESEVVAYALYSRDERGVYLRQFFVQRTARRQGLGSEAVRLLRREIVPMGTRIAVEVLSHNSSGRAFWAANGFSEYALTLVSI